MNKDRKKLLVAAIDNYNRAVQRRNSILNFSEKGVRLNSALSVFSNSVIMQAHDHMLKLLEAT